MTETSTEVDMSGVVEAAKAEPEPEPVKIKTVSFTFDEVTYQVRRDAVEDLEVVEWIEDEKIMKALKRILGDEQWDKFKDSQRDKETGRVVPDHFEDFINGLFKRVGSEKS